MSQQSSTTPGSRSASLPWYVAAVLAVLALIGGIFLGRVAFVQQDDVSHPSIGPATTADDFDGSARLEYIEADGVLILHFTELPSITDDEVYQVWMMQGTRSTSVGVLPPGASRWAFAGDPSITQTVLLTVEDGPTGSDHPMTEPVFRFDLVDFANED